MLTSISLLLLFCQPSQFHYKMTGDMTDVNQLHEMQYWSNIDVITPIIITHRLKKKCPICGEVTVDLPRHMRSNKHKFSKESSQAVVGQFGLRKPSSSKEQKEKKDYHYKRQCPIENCFAVTVHLDQHLTGAKHKVNILYFI